MHSFFDKASMGDGIGGHVEKIQHANDKFDMTKYVGDYF